MGKILRKQYLSFILIKVGCESIIVDIGVCETRFVYWWIVHFVHSTAGTLSLRKTRNGTKSSKYED